jgi:hypothetical protein
MSDQTPDSPPRPQYGEYATPEEQRARIRQSDVTARLDGTGAYGTDSVWRPPMVASPAAPTPAPAAQARQRPFDRIITFGLLAYGFLSVASSFAGLADYASYVDTVFRVMGVTAELSDPEAGKPWGIAAALVLAAGWVITALVSWASLRRGRLTWWIPVVGGIVFNAIASTLVLIPLMSDPAVWNAIVGSLS